MDKKLFSALLLAAAVMSSCSQNEVNEILPESDNVDVLSINTVASATRGTDLTTSSLNTSGEKVNLYYAAAATQTTGGSSASSTLTLNVFTYGTSWGTSTAVTWAALGYPTYFYSAHDGDEQTLTISTVTGTLDYEVAGTSSSTNHKDLVAYAESIEAMPTGGTLSVLHNHALSKINILAGLGDFTAKIASVTFNNLMSKNTLNFTAGAYSWDKTTNAYDNANTPANYTYDLSSDEVSVTSEAYTLATTTNAMMIIPQTTVDKSGDLSGSTATYIELLVCVADGTTDKLGYVKAQNYPGYDNLYLEVADEDSAYVDGDTLIADDASLYVKVGFAMGAYTFEDNKQYNITLDLGVEGSIGGVVLDSYYYTYDGKKVTFFDATDGGDGGEVDTDLPDDETEITPSENSNLAISVSVNSWSETVAATK